MGFPNVSSKNPFNMHIFCSAHHGMLSTAISALYLIITLCTYARGKAIGSVRLSICLSAQKSPDLEIWASEQHSKSVKIVKNWLHYASNC